MSPERIVSSGVELGDPGRRAGYRFSTVHPHRIQRTRQHRSSEFALKLSSLRQSSHTSRPRFTRRRPDYCDCGNLAVTVLYMRVGSDPQYTIRMPLCPACLKLEQNLE